MGGKDHSTLQTARLTLRPVRETDVAALIEGAGNYDVARWLAVVPYPYRVRDAEDFVTEAGGKVGRIWAIVDEEGLCGVISIDGSLGFWLARRAWGRGYLTEAGDAAVDAWFADPGAGRLFASHMADNSRSANVLRKLGFEDAGPYRIESSALDQTVAGRLVALSRARWKERRSYRLPTRRLRLRELREGDLTDLRRIAGDPRVATMTYAATSPWPEAAARTWLQAHRYRGRPGFRAAVCTRLGRFIGTIYIGRAPRDDTLVSAWFLDPDYWGRGLATEAAGAFLADTMDRFSLPTVRADHFADNPASGAVMRKLGFVETGVGSGRSAARLEPAPVVIYRLDRENLKVRP